MSALTKKSDTHQERFVHLKIENHPRVKMATVFARQIAPDVWAASVAMCHVNDAFDRKAGRSIARRKFFQSPNNQLHLGPSFTYDRAAAVALTFVQAL